MGLEELLVQKIDSLGPIVWQKAFGWINANTLERKFFGGYKIIDENVLNLLLRLSPEGFEEAIASGLFEKFEFGKTWVVAEITSEEEIDSVWPIVETAYNFVKGEKLSKTESP